MYSTVCVIGAGSVGGFIIKNISHFLDDLTRLVVIDDDIVEQKNIGKSVYRQEDVGKLKVDCIRNMLSDRVEVISIAERYTEGTTKIPKSDLVIDCRDYTYNRKSEIDVRLYLSASYLVVDCRKAVRYDHLTHGKYITNISNVDLMKATSLFVLMIQDGTLKRMIDNQIIQEIDIDFLSKNLYTKIVGKNTDLLYDDHEDGLSLSKVVNLPENILPIIESNKNSAITLSLVNGCDSSIRKVIEKNSIRCAQDVITHMDSMFTLSLPTVNIFQTYLVSKDNNVIMLIPETGAA